MVFGSVPGCIRRAIHIFSTTTLSIIHAVKEDCGASATIVWAEDILVNLWPTGPMITVRHGRGRSCSMGLCIPEPMRDMEI